MPSKSHSSLKVRRLSGAAATLYLIAKYQDRLNFDKAVEASVKHDRTDLMLRIAIVLLLIAQIVLSLWSMFESLPL